MTVDVLSTLGVASMLNHTLSNVTPQVTLISSEHQPCGGSMWCPGIELLMLVCGCQGNACDTTGWSSAYVCDAASVCIATCRQQWSDCWHLQQAWRHGTLIWLIIYMFTQTLFLPLDATPAWYMLSSCVCPSVTSRHYTKKS